MSNAVLALVFALFAGVGPVELPEYAPASDSAYTLDLELDGYQNGRMDPDRLLKVGNCTLERDAAYTYSLMMEAAELDGVNLRPVDCYRSYASQEASFNRRCPLTVVPIYVGQGVGDVEQTGTTTVRVCTGPLTAQAGHSNHGWGRAIDFQDRRGSLDCYDSEFHWLKLNAHRFGWVHPQWAHCGSPNQEPWHWEYGGVTDPTLVDFVSLDPALIATAE
ncbi:MAG: M15 family metallopeptidase [Actinomycetota bacterium]|nr:M15 family metallopeptidase [Actinomycetota bacterium]